MRMTRRACEAPISAPTTVKCTGLRVRDVIAAVTPGGKSGASAFT